MVEQYFGTKELYQVCLKANTRMTFGSRTVEVGEPVLYFDHISISSLSEYAKPIIARGGWGNLPRVIWEDRSEMTFSMNEGVMTAVGMGILFSSIMEEKDGKEEKIIIPKREGPFEVDANGMYRLEHVPEMDQKMFCFEYDRSAIQKKVDYSIEIKDKEIMPGLTKQYAYLKVNGENNKNYILDYYFKYGETSLLYILEKERFRGTFTLEGKFYTKDENEGKNVTNIMTMPKVRVISNISLRLGERADPTTSVFNILAMPVNAPESDNMLMKVVRLDEDIDNV